MPTDLRSFLVYTAGELQDQTEATLELLERSSMAPDLPLRLGQQQFADYLRDLLSLLSQRLSETKTSLGTASEAALRAHDRRLFSSSLVLDVVLRSIGWLGVTSSQLVSSGLNPHLKSLAAAHMGGAEVVVHMCTDRNYYSIMHEAVLEAAVAFMRDLDPTLEQRYKSFCMLALPKAESENVLLHSILYHELGHTVDGQIGLSERIAIDTEPLLAGKAPTDPQELLVFKQTMRRWVAELVADTFGVLWGGPACLIAGLALRPKTSVDFLSGTHPTDRIRYELMKQVMETTGSWSLFAKYLPKCEGYISYLCSQPVVLAWPQQTPAFALHGLHAAHAALPDITPFVLKYVIAETQNETPDWGKPAEEAIDFALKLLDGLIVPLRAGHAADARFLEPAELLLAGWSHMEEGQLSSLVEQARQDPEQGERQAHRLRLRHYRHIEKALQDMALIENWNEANGRLNN